jgi:hypothetical protein
VVSPLLVTGAAGRVGAVGRTVTELLLKQGKAVRAMVRSEDERALALRDMGAEVVVGDLLDLDSMHRAIAGCETMYFGMSVSDDYLAATANAAAVGRDEGLVQFHRELEVGYCRLVTISTDNITETNEYRSGVGAHWPFLSDAGRKVQKDLDIAEYTDPLHNPMIPHTIVLEPGLVIYKIYMGYWFFGWPTMEELRQDLRAVARKCRPDWDITKPELKAAWAEGRKELFYPYGKTFVQTLAEQD